MLTYFKKVHTRVYEPEPVLAKTPNKNRTDQNLIKSQEVDTPSRRIVEANPGTIPITRGVWEQIVQDEIREGSPENSPVRDDLNDSEWTPGTRYQRKKLLMAKYNFRFFK
jgi:hypothetical protein